MEVWVSLIGIGVGVLQGLNAIILSGLSKKITTICRENREDHKSIYEKLDAIPQTYQATIVCAEHRRICNENRDDKIKLRMNALEKAEEQESKLLQERRKEQASIVEERRQLLLDKLSTVEKMQEHMLSSFENLSDCISKYTKGECP